MVAGWIAINVIAMVMAEIARIRIGRRFLLRARELGLVAFVDVEEALGRGIEDGRTDLLQDTLHTLRNSEDHSLRELENQLRLTREIEVGFLVVSVLVAGFIWWG